MNELDLLKMQAVQLKEKLRKKDPDKMLPVLQKLTDHIAEVEARYPNLEGDAIAARLDPVLIRDLVERHEDAVAKVTNLSLIEIIRRDPLALVKAIPLIAHELLNFAKNNPGHCLSLLGFVALFFIFGLNAFNFDMGKLVRATFAFMLVISAFLAFRKLHASWWHYSHKSKSQKTSISDTHKSHQ